MPLNYVKGSMAVNNVDCGRRNVAKKQNLFISISEILQDRIKNNCPPVEGVTKWHTDLLAGFRVYLVNNA